MLCTSKAKMQWISSYNVCTIWKKIIRGIVRSWGCLKDYRTYQPDHPYLKFLIRVLMISKDSLSLCHFLIRCWKQRLFHCRRFMDLQSVDQPIKENLGRLFHTLEEKGSIAFMSCLQKEGAIALITSTYLLCSMKRFSPPFITKLNCGYFVSCKFAH